MFVQLDNVISLDQHKSCCIANTNMEIYFEEVVMNLIGDGIH